MALNSRLRIISYTPKIVRLSSSTNYNNPNASNRLLVYELEIYIDMVI